MNNDNAYDPNQQFNEEEEEDGFGDDETITPFNHVFNEEKNLTNLDYSRQVLHSISNLFLNIKSTKLIGCQKFKRIIKKYSSSWEGKRLTFLDMRHNMIGLLREYVTCDYNEKVWIKIYASHDVMIRYPDYVVNPYKAKHTRTSKKTEVLSRLWKYWLELRTCNEMKTFKPANVNKDLDVPNFKRSIFDIEIARKKMACPYRDLTEKEKILICDIYMGPSRLHPIHIAPTDSAFN